MGKQKKKIVERESGEKFMLVEYIKTWLNGKEERGEETVIHLYDR